jgi:hypothetical protein
VITPAARRWSLGRRHRTASRLNGLCKWRAGYWSRRGGRVAHWSLCPTYDGCCGHRSSPAR